MRYFPDIDPPRLLYMTKGENKNIEIDWARLELKNDVTVSSVVWARKSDIVAISGETLTESISSAFIAANQSGQTTFKVTATISDGSVCIMLFNVKIRETIEGV